MLVRLGIRDIVIIERLDLDFASGLSVLTGETGAGKSILLDSLGLALGARGDAGLVRSGAGQGSVTAQFELPVDHGIFASLAEDGLDGEPGELVLRRVVSADGRSKSFVNDQPVSAGRLRDIGDALVEIHGQFDDRGLLDPAGHRKLLDAFAGAEAERAAVATAHGALSRVRADLEKAAATLAAARAEEEYLRHAAAEIADLDPQEGEEEALAERRAFLQASGRVLADLDGIHQSLTADAGVETALRGALRRLDRMGEPVAAALAPSIAAFDRALTELEEGMQGLTGVLESLDAAPGELERIEERLFALRALGRKHNIAVADLPALAARFRDELAALDAGDAAVAALEKAVATSDAAYRAACKALSARRTVAARDLDAGVARELPPLKLGAARLRTTITPLDPADWGAEGAERVAFEVATNPGAPFGPLKKIASGGELARFMLALKVVLAARGAAPTLIFDEVDQGIGGATADAVGERLKRLSDGLQILVVTHSPQVAARGDGHYYIAKETGKAGARTRVDPLDPAARAEEIARMLSGAEITSEARAQAARLLGVA